MESPNSRTPEIFILQFSARELLFIDDQISLMRTGKMKDQFSNLMLENQQITLTALGGRAWVGMSEEFILQVLSGLDNLFSKDLSVKNISDTFPIEVNREDIFRLRELAKSEVVMGDEPVGVHIKLKIAKAIHREKRQFISELLGDIDDLLKNPEASNGNSDKNPNKNPDKRTKPKS